MEESEKRKERLKAMHAESAHAEICTTYGTSPGPLPNPLIESSSPLSRNDDHCVTPRFDFYTDPMAAFSANKKSKHSSPFPGVEYPEMNASPVHQMPGNYLGQSPVHPDVWSGSRPAGNYCSPVPSVSPRGVVSTPPMVQGGFGFPVTWGGGTGSPLPPGITNFNHGRGRPPWSGNNYGGNPGSHSGRGRGRRDYGAGSNSPGFGRGGNRQGSGFSGRGCASFDPEHLFHDSMLEDPWKYLEPILWRTQEVTMTDTSNSGTRSIKGGVSASSEPSLAEYLAASFNKGGAEPS